MIRALPGVFCVGEMLGWDAPTGGSLLTACFSTAEPPALVPPGGPQGRKATAIPGVRGSHDEDVFLRPSAHLEQS